MAEIEEEPEEGAPHMHISVITASEAEIPGELTLSANLPSEPGTIRSIMANNQGQRYTHLRPYTQKLVKKHAKRLWWDPHASLLILPGVTRKQGRKTGHAG